MEMGYQAHFVFPASWPKWYPGFSKILCYHHPLPSSEVHLSSLSLHSELKINFEKYNLTVSLILYLRCDAQWNCYTRGKIWYSNIHVNVERETFCGIPHQLTTARRYDHVIAYLRYIFSFESICIPLTKRGLHTFIYWYKHVHTCTYICKQQQQLKEKNLSIWESWGCTRVYEDSCEYWM